MGKQLPVQALQESEQQYHTLFDNVFDGVFRTTPDGKILTANSALVRILGFESKAQLLNVDIKSLYANPEDRKELTRRLEEEGEIRNAELTLRRRDGERVIVLENARVVKGETDSILYYEGTLTDITERKIAEDALQQSIRFMEELIMDAGEGIVAYDLDLRHVVWNPFMERLRS